MDGWMNGCINKEMDEWTYFNIVAKCNNIVERSATPLAVRVSYSFLNKLAIESTRTNPILLIPTNISNDSNLQTI